MGKGIGLFGGLLFLLLAAPVKAQGDPKNDLAPLEGTWEKSGSGKDDSVSLRMRIKGKQLTIRRLNEKGKPGEAWGLSLSVDEVSGIKVLALGLLGNTEMIAYSVEGDELFLAGKRSLFGHEEGISLSGQWRRIAPRADRSRDSRIREKRSRTQPPTVQPGTPIPVPPWTAERLERLEIVKGAAKTPILPPIREGSPPPTCEDAPDDAAILRALKDASPDLPCVYDRSRDDVEIYKERLVDRIDPPRFFPLVGPAQLHHCHWKCTVYYTETIESGYPFALCIKKPRVQVVYIDKDHLHLCPARTPEGDRSGGAPED